MPVAGVRRVERAAEQADARVSGMGARWRHSSGYFPHTAPKLSWIKNKALLRCVPGAILLVMDYRKHITLEPWKRGGKPCIRDMRITVYDVLGWLASGMSEEEILRDFPELTRDDIKASLAYAADRERRTTSIVA